MTRYDFCERILREIYNGQPSDDATINKELINLYLSDAIAVAAKQHYIENLKLDNITYVNGSFFTTFRNLVITTSVDDNFVYETTLPQIPIGIGKNDGISSIQIKNGSSLMMPTLVLNHYQWNYAETMPKINGVLCLPEGNKIYFKSTLVLSAPQFTASVRMISGGDTTDFTSIINVPSEWLPSINDYVLKQLLMERSQPLDQINDGIDKP